MRPVFGHFRLPAQRLAAAAALALPLAACAVELGTDQPPPRLYTLTPKSTFAPDLPRVDSQLAVDLPVAESGRNTVRIAVRKSPVSLEYFERANWIDTAPRMIQTLLVESFENSGRIVPVGQQSVALREDYSLITSIREFQAETTDSDAMEVNVRITAKLVRMPQRTIIAATDAAHRARAEGREMAQIVEAFDVALGKVLKRIVQWTIRTMHADAAERPPRPR